jgi:hypothetical protein
MFVLSKFTCIYAFFCGVWLSSPALLALGFGMLGVEMGSDLGGGSGKISVALVVTKICGESIVWELETKGNGRSGSFLGGRTPLGPNLRSLSASCFLDLLPAALHEGEERFFLVFGIIFLLDVTSSA